MAEYRLVRTVDAIDLDGPYLSLASRKGTRARPTFEISGTNWNTPVEATGDYEKGTSAVFDLPQQLQPFQVGRVERVAAPTTGTWRAGSVVHNRKAWAGVSAEEPVGWVCEMPGTPGVWQNMSYKSDDEDSAKKRPQPAFAHDRSRSANPQTVAVDPQSRGLVVDGLLTLPVGFYIKQSGPRTPPKWTDITSQSVLQIPVDEARHGFTHVAPYLSTNVCMDASNLSSAEAMVEATDRAGMAGLGLDLGRIVSGYQFAGSRCTPEDKMATLLATVKALAPMRGLLFHYLMDEPNQKTFPLATVLAASEAVRRTDPHHPIAGCFRPDALQDAPGYGAAVDIVMTDPYFIARTARADHPGVNLSSACPGGGSCNATYRVAELVDGLLQSTNYSKAIWLVPSVFGGGEAWSRQPTPYEMRAVSFAAVLHGATGLQMFVRSAPNVHPSSVRLWSEVRSVAMELTILAPWLLSSEAAPEVSFRADNDAVHLRGWTRRGTTIIIAVNMVNTPTALRLDRPAASSALEVLWHDRNLDCTGGQSATTA